MSKTSRAGSAFATLPFDGIDNAASVVIHDDFIGVPDLADFVDAGGAVLQSTVAWNGGEIAGGAVSNAVRVAGVADHPGIVQVQVGATSPADGDAAALLLGAAAANDADGDIVLDDNGVYIASVLRIPDVDAQVVEFGLIGQAPAVPNSSATDVVSFVWDPEDSVNVGDELFIAQINAASTDTEEAFTLAYTQNDWVLLEIYADDTSALFRLTTEDGSETIQLQPSAMPTVALRPAFAVENVGAAEEVLDIDLFHLRYMRKDPLVGQANDWLGA